ncbi:hypothetical protein ABZ829_36160 [Streptomyces xanthochromogenes]|uniref:hypothetical protein n=1 Tax=Streptomyces xanthochromogenes TaxID=67384 RepID=UPI0034380383
MAKMRNNKKIADGPKKPLSAFLMFALDQQAANDEIKNLPTAEQGRKTLSLWRSLPAEEREAYEERYRKELKAYGAAVEEYKKTDAYREHGKDKPPQETGPGRREHAITGYALFTAETRPAGETVSSHMRKTGLAWKQLSEQERKQYTDRAFLLTQKRNNPGEG